MFDKIVVAVDGSPNSMRAVARAGDMAATFGSEVVVVHVDQLVVGWGLAVESETSEEALNLADSAVRELKDRGVSARPEVRTALRGMVAGEIVEAAKEEGADIIIMGSRGLAGLTRVLLGSVAYKVLLLAKVPVLVVK